MEWTSIVGPLVAVVMVIVLRKVFGKKKQGGEVSEAAGREEFYEHLRAVRVEASLVDTVDTRQAIGLGRASGQQSEGIVQLEDRHIDSVNVVTR